jgi:2-C-methyl-D-erythritol 4-phosphate cytidylyltransferase
VTGALVEAVVGALAADAGAQAAIAATPVTDTVKRVCDGAVSETLDRTSLWAVQTPQVFRRAALERALDVPDEVLAEATDDAWLIEREAGRVIVVASTEENLKVTGSLDLQVAGALLERRAGEPSKAPPA